MEKIVYAFSEPKFVKKPLPKANWIPLSDWAKSAFHQLNERHQREVSKKVNDLKNGGERAQSLSEMLPKYWGDAHKCIRECEPFKQR